MLDKPNILSVKYSVWIAVIVQYRPAVGPKNFGHYNMVLYMATGFRLRLYRLLHL